MNGELEKRSPAREVAWVYALTLVVTVALTRLQDALPWFQGYALPLCAALFLYLPLELLQRQGADLARFGLRKRLFSRDVKAFLLVACLVFPPYLVGYHFWQTDWNKRELSVSEMHLARWPMALEDKAAPLNAGEVGLSCNRETLILHWRLLPEQKLTARFWGDGQWTPLSGQRFLQQDGQALEISGQDAGGVRLRQSGDRLKLDLMLDGEPLSADRLRLGSAREAADRVPYTADRSLWWLLNAILVQLLLVAFPEELFYRGYLQTRLEELVGRKRKICGLELNIASLLLTSALFALGHIATIPNPARLAVFFPSLLFGVMRCATGGLFASTFFHASCNLLVEIAALFYL